MVFSFFLFFDQLVFSCINICVHVCMNMHLTNTLYDSGSCFNHGAEINHFLFVLWKSHCLNVNPIIHMRKWCFMDTAATFGSIVQLEFLEFI